jgi:hypothetical protein
MKLIDIPVVFINPDHNEKYTARKQHMFELLEKIGFKNITHFKSGNENYPTCLLTAFIDILNSNMNDSPILLIEDDVEPFIELNSETEIDFPENTDAFYIGFSKSGGSKTINSHEGWSQYRKISDKHIRIFNMLTTHAIIYNSKQYKERVCSELIKLLNKPLYHSDVIISRVQPEYNIYGYRYPLFYQSVEWGNVQHTEDYTRFNIT